MVKPNRHEDKIVKLSKYERKMYQVFSLLMGNAIGANITTMKQISIYVAKSTDILNVDSDCIFGIDEETNCYQLSLCDGRRILFSRVANEFGFKILNDMSDMNVSVVVSEQVPGDLTTVSVYGEIKIKDNGMYVIGFRPNQLNNNLEKYVYINYYTDDEIDWVYQIVGTDISGNFDIVAKKNMIYPAAEENSFVVLSQNDNSFDCFSGIISDVITRIDLLCENVKVVRKSVLKKKLDDKK